MAKTSRDHADLSRRERQIMHVIYSRGKASAAQVRDGLPDPPSYSAVRAMLRILEDKGILKHGKEGPRYVYSPTLPRAKASQSALQRLVRTFFDGSVEQTVAALLSHYEADLSDDDLRRLSALIKKAREEGR